jgi:hypothetical protein
VNSFVGADLKRAEQFAAEMLSLGEQADDTVTRVVGCRASGATRGLGGTATSFSRKPLRGFACQRIDRTCRSGGRTRTAAAALVESQGR